MIEEVLLAVMDANINEFFFFFFWIKFIVLKGHSLCYTSRLKDSVVGA